MKIGCCTANCQFNVARLTTAGVYQWQRPIAYQGWTNVSENMVTPPAGREVLYGSITARLWLLVGSVLTPTDPETHRLLQIDAEQGQPVHLVEDVYPASIYKTGGVLSNVDSGNMMALRSDGRLAILATESPYESGTYPDLYCYVVEPDGSSWSRFLVAASGTITEASLVADGTDVIVSLGGTIKRFDASGATLWSQSHAGYVCAVGTDGKILLVAQTTSGNCTLINGATGVTSTAKFAGGTPGYTVGARSGAGYVLFNESSGLVEIVDATLTTLATFDPDATQVNCFATTASAIAMGCFSTQRIKAIDYTGALLWQETHNSVQSLKMDYGPESELYFSKQPGPRVTLAQAVNPW